MKPIAITIGLLVLSSLVDSPSKAVKVDVPSIDPVVQELSKIQFKPTPVLESSNSVQAYLDEIDSLKEQLGTSQARVRELEGEIEVYKLQVVHQVPKEEVKPVQQNPTPVVYYRTTYQGSNGNCSNGSCNTYSRRGLFGRFR